ncbi:GNAT family N-acetyltransferase [Paenibacillus sp.]|jgi:predicted acetyltransferase|uniref:GNAT family N-acetyltransferase n=1 Tax=Paenibacillus sp. TaxID=58172 RepID=UPI002819ADD2|nr:GNAT family N-acetyltransferase [Paenibacillus sp.]MDR0270474.1 GNAT family N-acetyltransferase [Paenibacillus sp.]
MTNHQPEIRHIANRAELEAVYDILGDVFPDGRDFFQKRLDHDSAYELSTTWIAMQQGDIASTIQVFPFASRIEDVALKIGGIGSVATVPAFRGQGHCIQILHRISAWMEQQEYDLSLLFAVINPFYEKVGWSTVPETMYEMSRADSMVETSSEYDFIPFDPSYTEVISGIYEQFNSSVTGTVNRARGHWNDRLNWPKWQASSCLLAVRNGVVVAYGHISETAADGEAYLDELCYAKGEEQAVIPLFHALSKQRPEAERILVNLPGDHVLIKNLSSWGALQKTLPYMMWKIIRFQPLLTKLAPVFRRRLQNSGEFAGASLEIEWEYDGKKAFFHYSNGEVTVEPNPREGAEYLHIGLTQKQFVSLLLHGYGSSDAETLRFPVLEVLFPKQNFVFYLMDRF